MTQLTFAGRLWNVSAYDNFTDDPNSAWVDSNGYLHLKVQQVGGIWKNVEVVTADVLGHGIYEFTLAGDQHNLDKNLVLGMFVYGGVTSEVDIELSYWGGPSTNPNMAYTVQPGPPPADMQSKWMMTEAGTTFHAFNWAPDHVYFASYAGSKLWQGGSGTALQSFRSSGAVSAAGAKGIINMWMYNSQPPAAETEVVIQDFRFIPAASVAGGNADLTALLQAQLVAMGAGDSEVAYVYTGNKPDDEGSVLLNRIANLAWAASQTDTAIRDQIASLEAQLSADALGKICGGLTGVTSAEVLTIELIEDLEVALGIHASRLDPGQTYYRWQS